MPHLSMRRNPGKKSKEKPFFFCLLTLSCPLGNCGVNECNKTRKEGYKLPTWNYSSCTFPRKSCDNRMLSLPGFLPPADLWAEERLSGSSPHSSLGKKGSRSCPVRRKIRKEGIVEKTSSFSVHGYLNYWISGIGLVAL